MRKIAISLFCILLTGCPYTTAFIIDENEKYTPTQSVEVLVETPNKPYKEIAILEARGELHDSIPNLLKSLRNKAKSIGADAIVPSEVTGKEIKQGLIYNPWLGGYHTTAGGTVPIMRAVAIKYVE